MQRTFFQMVWVLAFLGVIVSLLTAEPSAATAAIGTQSSSLTLSADDPGRLKNVRSKITAVLDSTGVASITVAVARDGKIVWEEGFGWANREERVEATPHTMYHLASVSKSFTATGLMVLVERRLIDLDRPANEYIGEAKLTAFAGSADEATVKRILFHTAGLPMYWNIFEVGGQYRPPDMGESIKRYGILVTAPGERYCYSNFGYGILDHIITNVSGTDYADFMKKEVFGPLGMTRTSVLVDSSMVEHVARMYDGKHQPLGPCDFDHRGASAVLSSAHDLVRYGMFHLKERIPEQTPILREETIDRLHRETDPQLPELKETIGFECLLGSFGALDIGGYRIDVCTGSMPGASSRLALVPSENLVTVVLCNEMSIDLWEIEKAILGAMLPGFSEACESEIGHRREESGISTVPPEYFVGSWTGDITTYTGAQPVKLRFSSTGEIDMTINGRAAPLLTIKTPLGEMGFRGDLFKGLFMSSIDTPDAARSPHVVLVEVLYRDGRLTGYAAAVAMNKRYCLPYWMELRHSEE
ncbi:MAG: beta-lactamase family protein [bacterium]|nr:MAG: beta-lactamase family protein [bacterium]